MRNVILLLGLTSAVMASGLFAQQTLPVDVDQKVRVLSSQAGARRARWLEGRVLSVDSLGLMVRTKGRTYGLLLSQIQALEVSRGRGTGKGALLGLGIGAGAGFVAGTAGCLATQGSYIDFSDEAAACGALSALALGAFGALLGAAAGSGERWERVVSPSGRDHVAIIAGPVLGLSIRF